MTNNLNEKEQRDLQYVRENPLKLCYIKDPSHAVQLEAVRTSGIAIRYIVNQTYDLCLEAVKKSGMSLRHIKNKTSELCMIAVQNDGRALQFIDDPTYQMMMTAVKQNGLALKYIPPAKQTLDLCVVAMQQNTSAYRSVCPRVMKELINHYTELKKPRFNNPYPNFEEYLNFEGSSKDMTPHGIFKGTKVKKMQRPSSRTDSLRSRGSIYRGRPRFGPRKPLTPRKLDFSPKPKSQKEIIVKETHKDSKEPIYKRTVKSLLEHIESEVDNLAFVESMDKLKDIEECGLYVVKINDIQYDVMLKEKTTKVVTGWLFNGEEEVVETIKISSYEKLDV